MAICTPNKISLDLYINKHVHTRVAQHDIDSREIIIQVTDKGAKFPIRSSDFSVRIELIKSDNTFVIDDIPSDNILEDGTIRLLLSKQMCSASGQCEARLLLSSPTTQQVIHTMHFNIIVDSAVVTDIAIESSNEFKSFESALMQLDYILANMRPITLEEIDAIYYAHCSQ